MQMKISKKYLNKKFWTNKKVLITGINGFIGGNLAKKLVELGATVTGISNNKAKNKFLIFEKIDSGVKLIHADIVDYKKISSIIKKGKFSVCFHLAAQVDVNVARNDPFITYETNIKGTYNILEAIRKTKTIKSIIVASSDKAYGEYKFKDLPYKEEYDLRPKYPYDVSKAAADLISKAYSTDIFGVPIIITRFSNIYGPGQLNFSALIPDCIAANLGIKKFTPRGNGQNKRDFLFVEDVVDLYLCLSHALYLKKDLSGEIFNAGTGKGYRVRDIIKMICKINNNTSLFNDIAATFKGRRLTGEISHQFMTYDKLYKTLKWKPSYDLNKGLEITINWYRKFLSKNNYKDFPK